MDALRHNAIGAAAPIGQVPHKRGSRLRETICITLEAYRARVRDTSDADDPDAGRRIAFARFVTQALDEAERVKGWANVEVAERSGIGRATLDRWKHGRWRNDPEPGKVNAFCETLEVDPARAYRALRWGRYADAPEPAPQMHPSIAALLRRLHDPAVPESEKRDVIRTVEWLANRPIPPNRPPPQRKSKEAG